MAALENSPREPWWKGVLQHALGHVIGAMILTGLGILAALVLTLIITGWNVGPAVNQCPPTELLAGAVARTRD
jgi:hypothetical protein